MRSYQLDECARVAHIAATSSANAAEERHEFHERDGLGFGQVQGLGQDEGLLPGDVDVGLLREAHDAGGELVEAQMAVAIRIQVGPHSTDCCAIGLAVAVEVRRHEKCLGHLVRCVRLSLGGRVHLGRGAESAEEELELRELELRPTIDIHPHAQGIHLGEGQLQAGSSDHQQHLFGRHRAVAAGRNGG